MILNSKIYGQEIQETPLLVFHGLFGISDNWGLLEGNLVSGCLAIWWICVITEKVFTQPKCLIR